jgi:REP element-mobilizing transposase RayT
MVTSEWLSIPENCPGVSLDAFVVMPDHLHGVLLLGGDPDVQEVVLLGDAVKRFKGTTTIAYAQHARAGEWRRFNGRLWQQRYFDRVVRNHRDLDRNRDYIRTNPERWELHRLTDT